MVVVSGWRLEFRVWQLVVGGRLVVGWWLDGGWWLEVVRKIVTPFILARLPLLTFQAGRPQSLYGHGISFRARCSG